MDSQSTLSIVSANLTMAKSVRKESDMSAPLTHYLEIQGYRVNCEVKHCDMTAIRGDEIVVIELKLAMSLRFLYQSLLRKHITDSVYLALPVEGGSAFPPEFRNLKSLLKRLEMGLILVRFLKTKIKVEVVQHPDMWEAPKRPGKARSILREIHAREIEYNLAGTPGQHRKMTAYRQRVLKIATAMSDGNIWTPAQLRQCGCDASTSQILRMNHYGWFIREERGKYRLGATGRDALTDYRQLVCSR